jgi:hypothetical protein
VTLLRSLELRKGRQGGVLNRPYGAPLGLHYGSIILSIIVIPRYCVPIFGILNPVVIPTASDRNRSRKWRDPFLIDEISRSPSWLKQPRFDYESR